MKTLSIIAGLLVAVFMVASAAFAINDITFYPSNTNTVLRVSCDPNADPIPANCAPFSTDGGTVWVYRDAGAAGSAVPCTNLDWWQNTYVPGQAVIQVNGTTAGDTLVPTYTGTCGTASARKFPLNHFYMNNCGTSEPLGMFLGEQAFTGCQRYDGTISASFFCVVTYKDAQNNKVVWISSPSLVPLHATPLPPPDVIEFGNWYCIYKSGTDPCVPDYYTRFDYVQTPQWKCVSICKDITHILFIGPMPFPTAIPQVLAMPGCHDTICMPANGFFYGGASNWIWIMNPYGLPTGGYLANTIEWDVGNADRSGGCVYVEIILAVSLSAFDASSIVSGIRLNFALASETNNDHFEIWRSTARDGSFAKIAEIRSQGNTAGGHNYEYTDRAVTVGQTYWYYLADVDLSGNRTEHRDLLRSAMFTGADPVPRDFALNAFPNPFNPTTTILLSLPEAGMVRVAAFDVTGRKMRDVFDGNLVAGAHRFTFDARELSAGVYFVRAQTGSQTLTEKVLLLK